MGLLESLDERFSSRSSESGEGSFSERLRRVASSDAARWMAVAAIVVVVALGVFLRRDGRPVEDLLPRADQGTTDAETTRPDSAGDIDDPVATSAVEVGAEGSNGPLIVHVAGQVQVPGLVEVPAGSRVADAVTAAGDQRRSRISTGSTSRLRWRTANVSTSPRSATRRIGAGSRDRRTAGAGDRVAARATPRVTTSSM